jgi:hypothetical protein
VSKSFLESRLGLCHQRDQTRHIACRCTLCALPLRINSEMPNRALCDVTGHRFDVRQFAKPLSPRISYSVNCGSWIRTYPACDGHHFIKSREWLWWNCCRLESFNGSQGQYHEGTATSDRRYLARSVSMIMLISPSFLHIYSVSDAVRPC